MQFSILICTWNRSKLLDQTLAAMRKLRIPEGVDWEIFVVNNNCTDDTDAVIARHAGHLPIRRLFEPRQGHSNARNCAIAAAKGDVIIWTDDDVLVDPSWLDEYAKAVTDWPEASYFGGPVDPWFSQEPPRWMIRHLHRLHSRWALRDFGAEIRALGPGEYPFGANLAFRKGVLRPDEFDERFGRKGAELTGNDETAVLERLVVEGAVGVWVGTARVKHFITPDRLTKRYIRDFEYCLGKVEVRKGNVAAGRLFMGAPRWAVRKFLRAKLRAIFLAPLANTAWLESFLSAAYYRGIIDETRAAASNSRPAPIAGRARAPGDPRHGRAAESELNSSN